MADPVKLNGAYLFAAIHRDGSVQWFATPAAPALMFNMKLVECIVAVPTLKVVERDPAGYGDEQATPQGIAERLMGHNIATGKMTAPIETTATVNGEPAKQ